MDFIIENLTDKPIWLQLNSGESLNIMPHSRRDVPEGEVRGNPKLKQLHESRVIRTIPPYGEAKPADAEAAPAAAGVADADDEGAYEEDPDADSRSPAGRSRKKKSV
ncbi:MAG: hypothetical protein AABM64_07905 [Pseudomonadota bacterium]